jgi:hypothetical protein
MRILTFFLVLIADKMHNGIGLLYCNKNQYARNLKNDKAYFVHILQEERVTVADKPIKQKNE